MSFSSLVRHSSTVALLSLAGCLPYTMGSTAATVEPHRVSRTLMMRRTERALSLKNDLDLLDIDAEFRTGIDERSDAGIRITSISGLTFSYKRRLLGERGAAGLAAQGELGLLGMGEAGLAGVSAVASARESDFFTPYGGVRVLATAPFKSTTQSRPPAYGIFLGARVGSEFVGISPEFAFFHDRMRRDSATTFGPIPTTGNGWLFVPSVTLHAYGLFDGFRNPRRLLKRLRTLSR